MKKLLLLSTFLICPVAAQAQTPGAQPEFCVTSPSQTANYNQLCISASSSGGSISVINHGSATGGLSIGVTSLTLTNLIVTGSATVPTRSPGDDSTHAASTAYVDAAVGVGSVTVDSTAVVGALAGNIFYTDGSVLKQSPNVNLNATASYQINSLNALSLPSTDTSQASIAIGPSALANLAGAGAGLYGNVAVGYQALSGVLTGIATGNDAVGYQVLKANTSGANNTGLGHQALSANTTGNNNVAVGLQSMFHNTTGTSNVAFGTAALTANTTADQNVAIGGSAMQANVDGAQNVAIGYQAMLNCVHSSLNVAIGIGAMGTGVCTSTGSLNVAIGNGNLGANTDGQENTAVGSAAMPNNTTGNFNTAVGVGALTDNTTGGSNVAVGTNAMFQNTTGSNNTGVGGNALAAMTTGTGGAAFGAGTLQSATGNGNTGLGSGAGANVTSGGGNTMVGFNAGQGITTGSFNTIIGFNVTGLSTTLANAVVLAAGSSGNIRADYNVTNSAGWTMTGTFWLPGIATTPGSKQPLCIDTSTHQVYAGTGGAC